MKVFLRYALILCLSVPLQFYFIDAFSQPFSIGQKYRGGVIFYVDSTGLHGLIAATADQGKTWGKMGRLNHKSDISKYNSDASASQENIDDATLAKRICSYYTTTVNDQTYHTWYLPSRKELILLYGQKSVVGGFTDGFYWSSSWNERFQGFYLLDFTNGNNYSVGIYCEGYIRPIQTF
jgi:hypothetical protein